MPPRSQQSESKQGLIITLVFFILATLGLGVSTYFGFAEQDKLTKAAAEAKRSEDTFKGERDYYKAQAMVYRGYMGLTEGMDGADTLGTLKSNLDGSLGSNVKDKADVTKTLKTLETMCQGWNGNQPNQTLEGALNKWKTDYEGLANQLRKAEADRIKANQDLQKRDEDLTSARKEFKDSLAKLENKFKQDFTKSDEDLKNLRAEMDRVSQQLETSKKETEETKKGGDAAVAKKEREIADLKSLVARKVGELSELQARSSTGAANMRTDWKISYLDRTGTTPYINLGSADRVKPQLTFTIHGLGVDGRPVAQSKGSLEVVSVVGPHLSRARITSEKDANRDPIVVNDVIYNPSWNPNIKKHVAIAGFIDLTGDGRDSIKEFIRSLERQNIVVDAYLDPKIGSIEGRLTYQTDYLILGSEPVRGNNPQLGEADKRIAEGQKQMQDEAKKYGVPIKNLLTYLDMIGYRLPHSMRAGAPSRSNTDRRSDIVPHLDPKRFPPPAANGEKAPPPPPPPDK